MAVTPLKLGLKIGSFPMAKNDAFPPNSQLQLHFDHKRCVKTSFSNELIRTFHRERIRIKITVNLKETVSFVLHSKV